VAYQASIAARSRSRSICGQCVCRQPSKTLNADAICSSGWLANPINNNAGLHLILNLPEEADDVAIAREANARHILVRPLSLPEQEHLRAVRLQAAE
jgi:hypothetical protein